MTIEPDTKDWTWVLDRPCPECGFDTSTVDVTTVGTLVRANAADWTAVLARSDARTRPAVDVWSPLEYACHVRDVFRIFDERLVLMLTEDHPEFDNWDQDTSAITDRYGEQDPDLVATELTAAATALAASFDAVTADQFGRTGRRSDGAEFTVSSFARYFAHDPVHHLHDVGQERGTTGQLPRA